MESSKTNECRKYWLGATKTTLEGLLAHTPSVTSHIPTEALEAVRDSSLDGDLTEQHGKPDNVVPDDRPSVPGEKGFAEVVDDNNRACVDQESSREQLVLLKGEGCSERDNDCALKAEKGHFEADAPLTNTAVTDCSSVSSEDGFLPLIEPTRNSATTNGDIFETNDSSRWDSSVADMVRQTTCVKAVNEIKESSDQKENGEEEDDNLLAKVGGGLAILGAVAGGVALAVALKRDDKEENREREK